jgi:hypothetical protein
VNVGGRLAYAPCVEIFAVLIKHLDAAVAAVIDENASRLRIDSDAMNIIEIARPCLLAVLTFLPPGHQVFAILVELHYASVSVSVSDEEGAIRQPCMNVGRSLSNIIKRVRPGRPCFMKGTRYKLKKIR